MFILRTGRTPLYGTLARKMLAALLGRQHLVGLAIRSTFQALFRTGREFCRVLQPAVPTLDHT
ncbi:MAG: hypothetical protein ACPL7J_12075 [Desulfomonilaceae bacterium]